MNSNLHLSNYSNGFSASPYSVNKSTVISTSLKIKTKKLLDPSRKYLINEIKQQSNIFSKQQLRSNSQNVQTKLPEMKSNQIQNISKNDQIFHILSQIPVQIVNDPQSPLVRKNNSSSQKFNINFAQQNQERKQTQDNNFQFDFQDLIQQELIQRENLEKLGELNKRQNREEIEIDQINLKSEEDRFLKEKKMFRMKKIEHNQLFTKSNIQAKKLFQKSSLKTPFFKFINHEIALLIAKFLNMKDLIKLATISKESRWIVSYSLQQTNYLKQIENSQLIFKKKHCIYNSIFRILKRQEEFQEFMKNNYQELVTEISDFRKRNFPDKQAILLILAAGIRSTQNQMIPGLDIIQYINKNGIYQSFSGIMLNFFPRLNISIPLPVFSDDNSQIKLLQFTKLIYNYVKDRIANQLSVQTQRNAFYQITLMKQRQLFMKLRKKVIPIYSKSIMRFHKESRFATLVNRNIFSIVLSFLKISEISVLMQSGKEMNSFVKISLESRVESIKIQKQTCLEQHKISSELANAFLYHKNLQQFQKEQDGILHGSKLCSSRLRNLFKAITFSVSKKEIGEFYIFFNQNLEKSIYKFSIGNEVPNPEKMHLIYSFLEKVPTLQSLKKSLSSYDQQTKRDCILLYLGMKSLLMISELKLTSKKFMKREKIYSQYFLPLDIIMIQYQKLLGIDINDEFLAFITNKIVNYFAYQRKEVQGQSNRGRGGIFSLL